MSLQIFSREKENKEKVYLDATLIAYRKSFGFSIKEEKKMDDDERISIYMGRNYIDGFTDDENFENTEYFYMEILDEIEQQEEYDFDPLAAEIYGKPYYRLAGTDEQPSRLCYEFALEYLRLHPDRCIGINEGEYFFLEDMEELEKRGGYYESWFVYKKNKQI